MSTEANHTASTPSTGGNPFAGVAAGDVGWKEMSLSIFRKYRLLHHHRDGGMDHAPDVQVKRKSLIWGLCKIAKGAGLDVTPADFMDKLGINKCSYTFGMGHLKYFLRDIPTDGDDDLVALQSGKEAAQS